MVLRIRRLLIQHLDWLSTQILDLPLKSQPPHPGNVISVIILHVQIQIIRVPEQRSLDRDLLDVVGTGKGEGLGGREVSGGGEVEGVVVDEEFEGAGSGGGVGGADEDGVEF